MDESVIRDYVKKQIAYLKENKIAPADIADDQLLFDEPGVDSLGLDSLDATELSIALDSEFELDDPGDVDLREFRTVNDIVSFVLRILAGEPQGGAAPAEAAP